MKNFDKLTTKNPFTIKLASVNIYSIHRTIIKCQPSWVGVIIFLIYKDNSSVNGTGISTSKYDNSSSNK